MLLIYKNLSTVIASCLPAPSDLRKPQRGFLIAQSGSPCQEPFADSGSLTNRAARHFERPQEQIGTPLEFTELPRAALATFSDTNSK